MTAYRDYLIVLSPPENICKKVKDLKGFCFNSIGEYDGHYSKAHISVQYWPRKKPVWIEPLIPKLERDLQRLSPVTLNINGFGYFDHQHTATIYAKLQTTPLTALWFKLLRRFFNTGDFEPHITIARTVSKDVFGRLWPYLKDIKWNEEFQVDKLTILSREMIGYDKSYCVFKEIPFNTRYNFNDFASTKLKAPAISTRSPNIQQVSLF